MNTPKLNWWFFPPRSKTAKKFYLLNSYLHYLFCLSFFLLVLLGPSSCGLKALPANPSAEPALETYLHQFGPTIVPDEDAWSGPVNAPTPVEGFPML